VLFWRAGPRATLNLPFRWKVKEKRDADRRGGAPGWGPGKTIRFWDDRRLLPLPARTPAGYRDCDPAVLERIAFIQQAQAAGLTLDAIGQVLGIRDGGQPPCVHVTALIARRLAQVQARLAALAERAAAQDPADCQGYCSIIAS
jgi:MerR family transcriptional regulator, copper efflux regulator